MLGCKAIGTKCSRLNALCVESYVFFLSASYATYHVKMTVTQLRVHTLK